MSRLTRYWLFASGSLCALGALLHLAIPLGGPAWYSFAGAPQGLVAMAQAGLPRPAVSCIVIACLLGAFAVYAFSALGLLRHLPAMRPVLGLIGAGLALRGLWFPVLALHDPLSLVRLCGRCGGLNTFVVATSALCLSIGIGFLLGALSQNPGIRQTRRPFVA
jgi:hypothetical protein